MTRTRGTASSGTLEGTDVTPTVEVLSARTGSGVPAVAAPLVRSWPREAVRSNRASLTLLSALVGVDTWAVTRMTEDTWTGLALETAAHSADPGSRWSSSAAAGYPAGTPVRRGRSLCHHLLSGPAPVVVADLERSEDPDVRAVAATWGVRGYLGVSLTSPTGEELGSLAGLSAAPLQPDDRDWAALLTVQATALQASLSADIAALALARQEVYERSLADHDDVTRLPDRRGWARLLAAEEEMSTPVGDPVGLVLVDLGVLRTVRSLRRAVAVAGEAAGDLRLARVGPRQLGVLAGGAGASQVARTANLVQARLEGAGFATATAHSMRAGLEPLSTTWSRTEHALVAARRERALPSGR
ncbi:hypothetical protein ASG41_19395 [Modestobacter sp. Leaf380]|nr:hypothetical protein ASG41_19395 [Modestobacter sp. Leaf380]